VLEPGNREKMARLDIVLTDAFFAMVHDLKFGRSSRTKLALKLDSVQVTLLTDSLRPRDIRSILNSQQPSHDGYALLKNAHNNILDTLNRTDYDLLMYGITTDSIEIHRKVQKIEINLERWRQEKVELGNVYAWINVPAYMFYLVEGNDIALESRVIVGAPDTPTPLFSSKIECFTIFPYWYVPRKITVNEYLPILKRDSSFIIRNNFDVLDRNGKVQAPGSVDWKKYNANNFPFTLRQREGTENSLGVLKFIFDNPYAVFLHDTNSKRLFKSEKRAYSHGCIRLEKANQFAHYLIGDNRTKLSSKTLDKYLSEKRRVTVSLFHPVPIHVRYFTCDVKNGELYFFDDLYKKDVGLIRALYQENVIRAGREKI
jgi:murein L,D-transpeptidase YcbB/YkuD